MKPIVVNLFGGPGVGKSSMMASVFGFLKWRDVNCEMAPEYAKEVVWEDTKNILHNQVFVFGQQHRRVFRLIDKVDVVITDAPLILSIIYDSKKSKNLRGLVLDEFRKFNNLNYFLTRRKKFNPSGRLQNEKEAREIDIQLRGLLHGYSIPYKVVEGVPESAETIGYDILQVLKLERPNAQQYPLLTVLKD